MGKVWVLDTGTKGTGAQMLPLEKVLVESEQDPPGRGGRAAQANARDAIRRRPKTRSSGSRPGDRRGKSSSALPPGHVRKKATGEIGRVRSVDPRSGTANVLWLKQGRASTVPLTAISSR
jgi:hypothetical protein